ncbi:tRNA intron endonuclease, partial [Mycena floridula]
MEDHPSYESIAAVLRKYPAKAGSLFQTYNDILYAQQWKDVQVLDLGNTCARGAITGRRPISDSPNKTLSVVPCSLAESLSMGFLKDVFLSLSSPPEIFLAINADDSSIVYYKISAGIVKPQL